MDGLFELNLKPISRDIFSKHFPSPSAAATVPQVGKNISSDIEGCLA